MPFYRDEHLARDTLIDRLRTRFTISQCNYQLLISRESPINLNSEYSNEYGKKYAVNS